MVLIHNMDSDEEQLQIVSYEEPDAFAATSHSDNRMGIKMTPKVPPQFDGQSSWFECEDLIDDWLGITTLDADKHPGGLFFEPTFSMLAFFVIHFIPQITVFLHLPESGIS